MLRNVLIMATVFVAVPLACAQDGVSSGRIANPARPESPGLPITVKTEWIILDQSALPASIRLPDLASCGVIDAEQVALLRAAQSRGSSVLAPNQTLTVRNRERAEFAGRGITFSPVLSDDQRVIRLALNDSSSKAPADRFPTMNPEVPVGKSLLVRVRTISEAHHPSFWERALGRKAGPIYSHCLLVVTPEIGGKRQTSPSGVKQCGTKHVDRLPTREGR